MGVVDGWVGGGWSTENIGFGGTKRNKFDEDSRFPLQYGRANLNEIAKFISPFVAFLLIMFCIGLIL